MFRWISFQMLTDFCRKSFSITCVILGLRKNLEITREVGITLLEVEISFRELSHSNFSPTHFVYRIASTCRNHSICVNMEWISINHPLLLPQTFNKWKHCAQSTNVCYPHQNNAAKQVVGK